MCRAYGAKMADILSIAFIIGCCIAVELPMPHCPGKDRPITTYNIPAGGCMFKANARCCSTHQIYCADHDCTHMKGEWCKACLKEAK